MNIIKTTFISLAFTSLSSIAGDKVDEVLSVKIDMPITIENVRGSISIEGWNKAQVSVKGELDDKTEKFVFEKNSDGISIKVIVPQHLGFDRSSNNGSNLVIKVPTSSPVTFDGVSTHIKLNNLQNSTNIRSISGNVNANNLAKHIEVSTISGNITATKLSGKVTLTSISGDIKSKDNSQRLRLENVSGNITANSTANNVQTNNVSGETTLKLAHIDDITINSVSDDVKVELTLNPNASVKASSVSGDIYFKFNGSLNARFQLESNVNDDIINKLTQDIAKKAKYGPGAKLNFTVGKANANVHVNTVSGDIEVSK